MHNRLILSSSSYFTRYPTVYIYFRLEVTDTTIINYPLDTPISIFAITFQRYDHDTSYACDTVSNT